MRIVMAVSGVVLAMGSLMSARNGAYQAPQADTEVFVATATPSGTAGALVVSALTNISRSPGYDNQPSFTPDGRSVLFVSDRNGKQHDIFRYDVASGQTTPLTKTTEGEYSPLVTPDGRSFSVIRVEADGTQRLWRFDLDGTNPRLVLEGVKPVGYHVWIDATHLALFVLGGQGKPNTLQVADTTTGAAEILESGIGRSLLRRPGRSTVSFISTAGPRWLVKEFDTRTRAVSTLVETADENRSQDTAWAPDGTLYMTSGSRLMAWREGQTGWTPAVDLAPLGVTRLTRLTMAPGAAGALTLAVVGEPVR